MTPPGRFWRYSGKRGWYLGYKPIVPLYEWPPTYTQVMREAGDNSVIVEPSQPAAEHTASEHDLPEEIRMRYCVNATVSYAGWVYVDADSPEDAEDEALALSASLFEIDASTAEVEFNAEPLVEPA